MQGCVSLKEEPNDEGVQEIQDKGEEGTNGESSLDVTREIMDRLNTESSPLGKITGAAVTDVSPQTNLIIGLSIIFGIVVAGVALYLFLFRKNA